MAKPLEESEPVPFPLPPHRAMLFSVDSAAVYSLLSAVAEP